jgi:hypothetical protein
LKHPLELRRSLRVELIRRARAAGLHLVISFGIAAFAAWLVFGLWYPGAYRMLAGGRDLFFLLTSVDVVLGPLLTFAVFNITKGWRHLRRDLAVIGLVQLIALGYGLHTVFAVRPVAMVLEGDRFRVVTAKDVVASELPDARPEYRALPVTGPWLLGTRSPKSDSERSDAIFMAIGGNDVGQRPSFWQPYADSRANALAKSRPLEILLSRYPDRASSFRETLREMKVEVATGRFVPVIARGEWTAVIDASGNPVGYLPANGYF